MSIAAEVSKLLAEGKQPDAAKWFALARELEDGGPLGMAIQTYQHLVSVAPNHPQARERLAALQAVYQRLLVPFNEGGMHLQRGEHEQAVAASQRALAMHPRVPDALYNLGLGLFHLRQLAQSEAAFLEAIRLQPSHFLAVSMLGDVYQSAELYEQAAACYRQAIAIKPDYFKVWANLGKLLQKIGDDAGAVNAYEQAHRLEPHNAEILAEWTYRLHHVCRWDKVAEVEAQFLRALEHGTQCVSPFIACLYASAEMQLINAKRWAGQHFAVVPPPMEEGIPKKIRIGYLSADFHHHATAFLISELFEQHDRECFEIIAYSCGPDDGSAERARIVRAVDRFQDIRMLDNRSAAELIRSDGVDILVDLKGYTHGERLSLMALRPAPVQMHYLGYPSTTGAPFIDYFIADSVVAPPGAEAVFSERLIRLPHCYQINDRKRPLPGNHESRMAHGLPEKGFVFCGFNRTYKITPAVFDVWMRLLAAVDGSVLWLYEQHPEASANLKREAKARGIDPARIVIAKRAPQAEHLARYRHADLFLDTSPVCGHTTASDALWCGVPVVTMITENFAGRVAASALTAVSLPELITADLKSYETLALALARDPARLTRLRRHLEKGRMRFPLFDSTATTQALQAAYNQAVTRYRAGLPPEDITISN